MISPKASEAALCAHEQNKFWEYHDVLFENQNEFEVESLKGHAKALALDEAKFAECLDSGRHAETIQKDIEAGKKAGVRGTPAFFVNGVMLSGAQPIEKFKEVIDRELQAR
jgi:protein-disulfide isomerase